MLYLFTPIKGMTIENIFEKQTEFIDLDPRVNRPKISGPSITKEFNYKKHLALIPPIIVKNKTVLDLGSCLAGTGAWVLSHGATYYKGIEIQEEFVQNSKKALSKYYSKEVWEIDSINIEEFLNTNTKSFDIVVANGILHSFTNAIEIIEKICKISNIVIIESSHPNTFQKSKFLNDNLKKQLLNSKDYEKYIENEPFLEMGLEGMTVPDEKTLLFNGLRPSLGAIKQIMYKNGFVYENKANRQLKKELPKYYSAYSRFGAIFIKKLKKNYDDFGFLPALNDKSPNKIYEWNNI